MTTSDKNRQRPVRFIGIFFGSAAITVSLICAGGYTVFSNMRAAEAERGWVDHSQTLLSGLQTRSSRLDRLDSSIQLYVSTGERSHLRNAVSTVSQMEVSQLQLQEMTADNKQQLQRLQKMDVDLHALSHTINNIDAQSRTVVEQQIMTMRNDLALVQQEERRLLTERTEHFNHSSYRSFVVTISFLGLSLLIVGVLFAVLFRDALRRTEDEEKLLNAKRELESNVNKLTMRADESSLLTTARDELQLCTTSRDAHESLARHLDLMLPGTSGATLVINNSRRMVEIVARWGNPKGLLDGFDPDSCCGLRGGKIRWRRKGKTELHCTHFVGTGPDNYVCVPLAAHGETQGFLFICCDTPAALAISLEREPLIQEMCELGSLSIASLNLRSKLEGQSIRDGLTGLFNRHFMEISLERELHRAARHRTSLAVLMMDVDHFKQFNDTFGHEAGDIVLRSVAECFRKTVRDEDVICRYGGEEFLIIMPDCDEHAASSKAEMIRAAVSELKTQFRGEALRSITLSVGVAVYPLTAENGSDLIRFADNALYRAKKQGRDRVVLAENALHLI